jgi:hypothetical protein
VLNALFTIALARRYTGGMVALVPLLMAVASLGAGSPVRVEVQATATVRILAGERVHFADHEDGLKTKREDSGARWRETLLSQDGRAVPAALLEFE